MKKIFGFMALAALAAAITACGTTAEAKAGGTSPVAGIPGVPDFVNQAYQNASEDVIVGVGTYKVGVGASASAKMGQAMTIAQTRARADISRQLTSIVKNMVTDYTATSELDETAQLAFSENITQALSKSEIKGAKLIQSDTDPNGVLWVVMEYSKSLAEEDVNQAASAAKLAVPAAAAFDALQRMDNAFDKAAAGGPNLQAE